MTCGVSTGRTLHSTLILYVLVATVSTWWMDDWGMKRKVRDSSSVLSWLVARWVSTAHRPPPRIHSPSRVSSRLCRAVPGDRAEK